MAGSPARAQEAPSERPPDPEWNELVTQYQLFYSMGRYPEAAERAERALRRAEAIFGEESEQTAQVLNDLGHLALLQNDSSGAVTRHRRALAIRERLFVSDGPAVVQSMRNLAKAYRAQGRFEEAADLLRRAMPIIERHVSGTDPFLVDVLKELAAALRRAGHPQEAGAVESRIESIRAEVSSAPILQLEKR